MGCYLTILHWLSYGFHAVRQRAVGSCLTHHRVSGHLVACAVFFLGSMVGRIEVPSCALLSVVEGLTPYGSATPFRLASDGGGLSTTPQRL